MTSVKNKIRGIERLLRKVAAAKLEVQHCGDFNPATLHMSQADKDQQLQRSLRKKLGELQDLLAKRVKEALERKFAVRYHKVEYLCQIYTSHHTPVLVGLCNMCHN